MLSTFICVLTLDRIGRRKTLYWGSVAQGIAMFLVGGLSAEGLNATTEGRSSVAKAYGAAAAAMVILYTFVFGATWLTVWSFCHVSSCLLGRTNVVAIGPMALSS